MIGIYNDGGDPNLRSVDAARIREFVHEIAENDLIYPPHDPGDYMKPKPRDGRWRAKARALLRDLDAQGADQSGVLQDDLHELLRLLGLPDDARPQSPHEVFQHALGVLRQRLDAQGLAPAGWLPARVEQAAWWCCDTSCEPRDKPCANCIDRVNAILEIVSGEQPIQPAAPASPSPALDAPTVEACLKAVLAAVEAFLDRYDEYEGPRMSVDDLADYLGAIPDAIRALISGVEAGERPVPAKAEPADDDAYCDDPHTERMAAIRRELTRAEPAADAGEVERAVLREIARQKLSDELDEDQHEQADFEGAYDTMIRRARAILVSAEARPGKRP